jgi:GT2 family glycosyltransferase
MTLYPFLAKIIDLGKDAEVIIVIQEASKFVHQVNYLESIFRRLDVNYQLLLFDHNVGFSAANNAALKIARAPVAVLVNPDIIIDDVGVYARIANVARSGSVVGATLRSDADEIMHRGLEINEQGVLRNGRISRIKRTFHTGRHATLDAITEGQILEATAVTGALIAVSQDTWRRVGGLSEEYVFAHFEDIDFCHTARKLGVPVYVYDTKLIRHIESYGSRENEVLSSIKQINSVMFNKRNS